MRIWIPIKEEEVENVEFLVNNLRKGDQSVIDKILKAHIRLTVSIASKYASKVKSNSDEIVSAALYGLFHAIYKAPEKLKDNNIAPWIASCVHRYCGEEVINILKKSVCSYSSLKRGRLSAIFEPLNSDYEQKRDFSQELKECIESLAIDDLDLSIIKLRIEGYTDEDISQIIGIPKTNIFRRRKNLEQRFQDSLI